MGQNRFQSDQMKHDAVLSEIAPSTETPLNTILSNINNRVVDPLSLSVNGTDRVLTVGHSVVTIGPNGKQRALPQLKGVDPGDVYGSMNLSTGLALSGVMQDTTPPSKVGNANKYVRAGVELRSDKKLYVVWGTVGTTDPTTAGAPAFSKNTIAAGEILLQINGTEDNFNVPTMASIKQFGAAGSGGGSGSGVGGINYVDNFDAEIDTSGWAQYGDTPGLTPEDGTGGTGFLVLYRTTTNPLRGLASFRIFKPGAVPCQGSGISYDLLAFDNVDANSSVITVSFDWDNNAGYADTLAVFLYDKTGAALCPALGDNTIYRGKGNKVFQFVSSASSTSYRLIIHERDTSFTGYEGYFDNVVVGPKSNTESLTMPVYKNAHGLSVGNIVTANTWVKADAESASTNRALAMVIDVVDANNFVALLYGRFRLNTTYSLGQYYLSDAAGTVVNTKTQTTVVPVFVVDYSGTSVCSGIFNPGQPEAETEEGDLSFRPRNVGGTAVNLRGGAIKLSSGEVLVSGSGLFEYTTKVGIAIDLATVYGSTPPNGTYWLYIDRQALPAAVNLGDSGRPVINVSQASNFKLLTTPPSAINPLRYVEVGYFQFTSGSITAFGHTPSRYHDQMSDFFSTPEVYSNTSINTETVTNLTHSLSGIPQFIQLYFWDNSASERQPLDASSYVRKASATTITVDSNGFTFDSGDYLEVKATYIPVTGNQIASMSTQFETGWYTDTATTTVAHNRTDMEDLKGIVVQEWNTTTGQRRLIPTETLVVGFDNTNLYLDWTGFTPSATLKYRVTTSGNALPQALPYYLGGYTKYVGLGIGGYSTLAAALAASVAGDSILVGRSETITTALALSASDVKIEWMPGVKTTVGAAVKGIVVSGSRCNLVNPWFEGNFAGTIPVAIEISGDDCFVERAKVTANLAGCTITAGYNFTATAERNWINGTVKAIAGTITSAITDAGTDNDYSVRG